MVRAQSSPMTLVHRAISLLEMPREKRGIKQGHRQTIARELRFKRGQFF
jgi:hypothetical protein